MNPIFLLLSLATVVSFFLGEKAEAFAILAIMFATSGLDYANKFFVKHTVKNIGKKVSTTVIVLRKGLKQEIRVDELKIGDTVFLYPGVVIPAETENGVVVSLHKPIATLRPETDFQKGFRILGIFLVKAIVFATILILTINIFSGKTVISSIIFSLTIAVGLTPELLPLVMTISLTNGARHLAKLEIFVKQLTAIEDLGDMDLLCVDKTGTLTQGKSTIFSYFDVDGVENDNILKYGLICNQAVVHHRIIGDSIDTAIWNFAHETKFVLPDDIKKIAEEPFNHARKAMYCVADISNKRHFIYKGAAEPVLEFCRLNPYKRSVLNKKIRKLHESGLRVIAIAQKEIEKKPGYDFSDAKGLNLVGFMTFSDIPLPSAKISIEKLVKIGVAVKIITGDNEIVTKEICRQIGFDCGEILLGNEISQMTDEELKQKIEKITVFARTTPEQKLQLINLYKENGHTVGFLGDGLNDSLALRACDVGISVNTAVDTAKDAASVILLQKNLSVIADGITTGRKIFHNLIKYLLMVTSFSFGNMFSSATASFLLPFFPMASSQVLLTNYLYGVAQFPLSSDNVDAKSLIRPSKWNLSVLKKYIVALGVFNVFFGYGVMGFLFNFLQLSGSVFQTMWFTVSLLIGVLAIFIVRNSKTFPSLKLVVTAMGVILIGLILPYSPLANYLSFSSSSLVLLGFAVIITGVYLMLLCGQRLVWKQKYF